MVNTTAEGIKDTNSNSHRGVEAELTWTILFAGVKQTTWQGVAEGCTHWPPARENNRTQKAVAMPRTQDIPLLQKSPQENNSMFVHRISATQSVMQIICNKEKALLLA